jgi:hypothetical protein
MNNTSNNLPFVIKANGAVTLYLGGDCLTVAQDHPNYNKIVDALKSGNHAIIDSLVNVAKAITAYASDKIKIDNGQVYYGTFVLHNTLTERIIKMMNDGFKVDHMIRFLDNLMLNPSKRAVDELYTFLENFGLPITEDGYFLAYKAVTGEYKDIYTRTIDNHIGQSPAMLRNMVDDNYGQDCSHGLHVGALEYVIEYGAFTKGVPVPVGGKRLLIVKVNPKNVVCVPKYEGHTKMRVCEYTVIDEITDVVKALDKIVYTSTAKELVPDQEKKVEVFPDAEDAEDEESEEDIAEEELKEVFTEEVFPEDASDVAVVATPEETTDAVSTPDETVDSEQYDSGYALGSDDALNGEYYQSNLEVDESDTFKHGYADGYNDRKVRR